MTPPAPPARKMSESAVLHPFVQDVRDMLEHIAFRCDFTRGSINTETHDGKQGRVGLTEAAQKCRDLVRRIDTEGRAIRALTAKEAP